MREDLTEIGIVLDRSGSMQRIRFDTIGGFNTFIKTQKDVPGDANVTLVVFNDTYDIKLNGVNIRSVKDLTEQSYVPHGCTALNDAIGVTVDTIGKKLSNMSENDRPAKVIITIITDGEENNSKEYTLAQIQEKIKHQKEKYNWEFVFIGTDDINVESVSRSLNIPKSSTFTFSANAQSTQDMYATLSTSVTGYRGGAGLSIKVDKV